MATKSGSRFVIVLKQPTTAAAIRRRIGVTSAEAQLTEKLFARMWLSTKPGTAAERQHETDSPRPTLKRSARKRRR